MPLSHQYCCWHLLLVCYLQLSAGFWLSDIKFQLVIFELALILFRWLITRTGKLQLVFCIYFSTICESTQKMILLKLISKFSKIFSLTVIAAACNFKLGIVKDFSFIGVHVDLLNRKTKLLLLPLVLKYTTAPYTDLKLSEYICSSGSNSFSVSNPSQ